MLFCDMSAKRLQQDKGFSTPPWCDSGAAVAIQYIDEIQGKKHLLVFDEKYRQSVNTRFLEWFGIEPSSPRAQKRALDFISSST